MKDKGGRRCMADRRQFAYFEHFPERRGTRFRRSGVDRRTGKGAQQRPSTEKRATQPGGGRKLQ